MGTRLSKRTGATLLRRTAALLGSHWRDTTSLSALSITHSTGLRVELDLEAGEHLVFLKFGDEGEYGKPQPLSMPYTASGNRGAVALAQQITDMLISEHMNPTAGPASFAAQDQPATGADTGDAGSIAEAVCQLLACAVAPGGGADEFELLLGVLDSVKVTVTEDAVTFRLRHFGQADGPVRSVPTLGVPAAKKASYLVQGIVRALLCDREQLVGEFKQLRNRAAKARALLS
ncbi:hypothetical protein [Kitasatospora sp. NPDC090091]|uniref:hypothetical protein n=1 Tax=Kitasatospora sp. NPDC090091 TaxID=3364081 RepID=UPI0037FE1467